MKLNRNRLMSMIEFHVFFGVAISTIMLTTACSTERIDAVVIAPTPPVTTIVVTEPVYPIYPVYPVYPIYPMVVVEPFPRYYLHPRHGWGWWTEHHNYVHPRPIPPVIVNPIPPPVVVTPPPRPRMSTPGMAPRMQPRNPQIVPGPRQNVVPQRQMVQPQQRIQPQQRMPSRQSQTSPQRQSNSSGRR